MTSGCAFHGGCPSDYIAIAIAACALIVLFSRSIYPFVAFGGNTLRSSGFWLVIVQLIGSFDLLLSLVLLQQNTYLAVMLYLGSMV